MQEEHLEKVQAELAQAEQDLVEARAAVSSAVGANRRDERPRPLPQQPQSVVVANPMWRPGPRTPPLTADEARRGGFMVGGTYVPPVPPTPTMTWNGGFGGRAEREDGELTDSEDDMGFGLFD